MHPDSGTTNEFGATVTAQVLDLRTGEGDPEAVVGDFTGDGANDGVVTTTENCGGNGVFGGTYAFDSDGTLLGGLPQPAQPASCGTLGALYLDLPIVDGGIEGTATGLAPDESRAEASLAERVRFEWDGSTFVESPATTDSESALADPSASDTAATPSTTEATDSSGTSQTVEAGTTPEAAGAQECATGVSTGGETSCPFAKNVAQAYRVDPGDTVTAYSPVTEKTYTMTCTPGSPVVCRGGRNAIVYID